MAAAPKSYEVLVGLNYGDTRREPGEIADDIPAKSITWLVEQGCIRPATTPKKSEES